MSPQGPSGGSEPQYPGSDQVALDFMNALLVRDYQAAYDNTCITLQIIAESIAAETGQTPPEVVASDFYTVVLGGQGFVDGSFDFLEYDSASDSDVGGFTLVLEDGSSAPAYVEVDSSLAVCNWYGG
jgi:hypothetical protein